MAKTLLDTFQTASMWGEIISLQQNPKAVTKRWGKPEEPYVKANWDAALNTSTNSMSLGGIIRDSNGNVLVTVYSFFSQHNISTLGESSCSKKINDGLLETSIAKSTIRRWLSPSCFCSKQQLTTRFRVLFHLVWYPILNAFRSKLESLFYL